MTKNPVNPVALKFPTIANHIAECVAGRVEFAEIFADYAVILEEISPEEFALGVEGKKLAVLYQLRSDLETEVADWFETEANHPKHRSDAQG